jgi:hypothetical protein
MSDRTIVSLVDVLHMANEWLGVIVLNNGVQVEWQHQMGGTACGHPTAAGLFVPLVDYWRRARGRGNDPLYDQYLRAYDSELVEKFLTANPDLANFFTPLEDDSNRANWNFRWGEAWVPVCIREDQDVLPFPGEAAVIVYPNSD